MKFYAPTQEPVHIALSSGHTTLITFEGTDIDKMFFAKAFELDCSPHQVVEGEVIEETSEEEAFQKAELVSKKQARIKAAE